MCIILIQLSRRDLRHNHRFLALNGLAADLACSRTLCSSKLAPCAPNSSRWSPAHHWIETVDTTAYISYACAKLVGFPCYAVSPLVQDSLGPHLEHQQHIAGELASSEAVLTPSSPGRPPVQQPHKQQVPQAAGDTPEATVSSQPLVQAYCRAVQANYGGRSCEWL